MMQEASEGRIIPDQLRRRIRAGEGTFSSPTRLTMALQWESLISGLEIARPFCYWACP
jgi:hypothetical protein